MPYQLIYSSAASTPLAPADLEALLAQAQANNARAGITGALVYVDGCFLQVLEGPQEAVRALMARIATDLRHEALSVLQVGDVPAASFADWQMAYVGATSAQIARWAGLADRSELPSTLEALRHDRQRVMQLARSILGVLQDEPGAEAAGG